MGGSEERPDHRGEPKNAGCVLGSSTRTHKSG